MASTYKLTARRHRNGRSLATTFDMGRADAEKRRPYGYSMPPYGRYHFAYMAVLRRQGRAADNLEEEAGKANPQQGLAMMRVAKRIRKTIRRLRQAI